MLQANWAVALLHTSRRAAANGRLGQRFVETSLP